MFLDSYNKFIILNYHHMKHFLTNLKKKTNEEYNVCVNAWKDNNMKTFKGFLEWYNNLDVLPFVEAIENMK